MASSVPANVNGSYLQQSQVDPYQANAYEMANPAATNAYTAPPAEQAVSQAAQEPVQQEIVDKDEVGWLFVKQYYTTLNKTPERLHLFYNRKSTMIWGEETDASVSAVSGRTDISNKITSSNFNNCKVRVTCVDSQSSLNNGIIIQVIGEMSNDGEPNKKFAQTFFLAEQPNGYFVLNDTLRFLNLFDEEEQEAYEGEEEVVEEEPVEVTVEDATVEVEVKAEVISEEPVEVVVNGNGEVEVVNGEEETKEEEEPEVKEEEVAAPVEEEAVPEPEAPKEEEPAPVVEEAPAPEPVPEPAPAPKEEKPAPPPPPAVPAAPPKPKTWANLVAATTSTLKPVQNAVAAVVPGVPSTSTPEPKTDAALPPPKAEQPGVSMPAQKGAAAQAAAASQDGWTTAEKKHPKSAAAQGEQNPTLAFIRNVTEKVDAEALKAVLTKFGPLKQFEVSRQRNCAFVEFSTPGAFKAAAAANPHHVGDNIINVEERRSRTGAQAGPGFGGRGGYQTGGRGGQGQTGGRGGFGRGERREGGERGGAGRGRGGFRRGGAQ